MATIIKKNKKFYVVYDYHDAQGVRKQKWEPFTDKASAQRFLLSVETKKSSNSFIAPSTQTVAEFFEKWLPLYAKQKWQYRTYATNAGLIRNHILPALGDQQIQKISPMDIELFLDSLQGKKVAGSKARGKSDDEIPSLTPTTIRHIYNILSTAFDKAAEWREIESSPVLCDPPKRLKSERGIWDAAMLRLALANMRHQQLHLAVHMTFICSLRIGEALGLTWDCVDLENKKIHICKTIQRVDIAALKLLPKNSLILEFPAVMKDSGSKLILKEPKTPSSNRVVYISEQLKCELQRRKELIQ